MSEMIGAELHFDIIFGNTALGNSHHLTFMGGGAPSYFHCTIKRLNKLGEANPSIVEEHTQMYACCENAICRSPHGRNAAQIALHNVHTRRVPSLQVDGIRDRLRFGNIPSKSKHMCPSKGKNPR
jgi:hypothetical protein